MVESQQERVFVAVAEGTAFEQSFEKAVLPDRPQSLDNFRMVEIEGHEPVDEFIEEGERLHA